VISQQVLAHAAALKSHATGKATESGARSEVNEDTDLTERALVRLRMAILSAYAEADDPRIAKFGPLGATDSPMNNLVRLTALVEVLKPAVASGEVAVVADLKPEVLALHATSQDAAKMAKAGSIAKRQTGSTSLGEHRKNSETMLRRLKNHVKSHYPGQLEAFGFGLPAPATRPRLKKGEPESPATPTR